MAEMKTDFTKEIFLNHLTTNELLLHRDDFSRYKELVICLLGIKEIFFTEQELFKNTNSASIKELLEQNPEQIISLGARNVKGEKIPTWLDLGCHYIVKPDDFLYETFFSYKLRQLRIMGIDAFLNYQLQKYYEGNVNDFSKFLTLAMRQCEILLTVEHITTVKEWIEQKEKQQQTELSGINKNIKGRPKREADDNLTALNQELTALLIHYLQKGNTIFKGEYLSNKLAGEAFHVLTGYSAETIRQSLSEAEMKRIASKKNLDQLHNHLTYITNLINKDIKQNK